MVTGNFFILFFFCQVSFMCIELYENIEKGKKVIRDFFYFFVDWLQQNFIVHPQQK